MSSNLLQASMQKTEIFKQQEKLRRELESVEKQISEFNKLPIAYQVADMLHELTCTSNHTDMCGYHYEDWKDVNFNSFLDDGKYHGTKYSYVRKAHKMLSYLKSINVPEQKAVEIISNIFTIAKEL